MASGGLQSKGPHPDRALHARKPNCSGPNSDLVHICISNAILHYHLSANDLRRRRGLGPRFFKRQSTLPLPNPAPTLSNPPTPNPTVQPSPILRRPVGIIRPAHCRTRHQANRQRRRSPLQNPQ